MARRTAVLGHLIAVSWLAAISWFVRQPIQGDMALWSQGFAAFFTVAASIVILGLFAWLRWGSFRTLVAADLLGLGPLAVLSLAYGAGAVVIAGPLVVPAIVGLAAARRAPRPARDTRPPDRYRIAASLALAGGAAIFWWYALTEALDFVGDFVDYGLPDALMGATLAGATVLWLARVPGPLLGVGPWLLVTALPILSDGLGSGYPESVALGVALLVVGITAVCVAGRDILETRSGRNRVVAASEALATLTLLAVAPSLAPLVVLVAMMISVRRASPVPATLPAMPDPT